MSPATTYLPNPPTRTRLSKCVLVSFLGSRRVFRFFLSLARGAALTAVAEGLTACPTAVGRGRASEVSDRRTTLCTDGICLPSTHVAPAADRHRHWRAYRLWPTSR